MKIYFMKQKAIDFFKANMGRLYANYFQKEDNSWMEEEFGEDPFVYFMDVPEFELASLLDDKTPGEIDHTNCKIVFDNLKVLSESQASDERLWAGLCNNTFYKYLRKRYGYSTTGLKDKERDATTIISRFFFSGGIRAGFYRNSLAKCWWVGHATYDKSNLNNHFEMLDIIGYNDLSTKISDIFYNNTFAANPIILNGICKAFRFYSDHGIKLRMIEDVRPAIQYLNAYGGATLLDVLTSDEIKDILVKKISETVKGQKGDFEAYASELGELEADTETSIIDKNEDEDVSSNNIIDSIETLDAEIENEESVLGKPEFVTWGCYIKVHVQNTDKVVEYHLPLESDKSRQLWLIEKKMLGKQVGHRIYLSGAWYELIDFGWEEDFEG